MDNTKIEWTDISANPIKKEEGGFFCIKVSPGCKYCYAERENNRFNHDTHIPYKATDNVPDLILNTGMIDGWARKRKRNRIFVSSMTDVFADFVPKDYVFKILDGMVAAPNQIFQLLTKRSGNMLRLVDEYCNARGIGVLPANIYCMVSVEDQVRAYGRIPDLVKTRCTRRGLSMEPLLGMVDLVTNRDFRFADGLIDWVIVGGESGSKARPMHPEWVYKILNACMTNYVPFFFKQWGEWSEYEQVDESMDFVFNEDGNQRVKHICLSVSGKNNTDARKLEGIEKVVTLYRFGKKTTGRSLNGILYNGMPIDMLKLVTDRNRFKVRK